MCEVVLQVHSVPLGMNRTFPAVNLWMCPVFCAISTWPEMTWTNVWQGKGDILLSNGELSHMPAYIFPVSFTKAVASRCFGRFFSNSKGNETPMGVRLDDSVSWSKKWTPWPPFGMDGPAVSSGSNLMNSFRNTPLCFQVVLDLSPTQNVSPEWIAVSIPWESIKSTWPSRIRKNASPT